MRGLLVGALSAAAAVVLSPGASAAPASNVVSSNWAGYGIVAPGTRVAIDPAAAPPPTSDGTVAATPAAFTSVTGTWRQPKVTCTAARPAFSAVWVGLGGLADDARALEQIGTGADCTERGSATYHAWYELLPDPPVRLVLKVRPGDTITTSVNVDGSDVLLQIKNRTRRTSVTKHLRMDAPDVSSAEWIVEAPAQCGRSRCRPLPLANFGSVTFSRIAAKADAHPGTISDASWTALPIELNPLSAQGLFEVYLPGSGAGATPSDFTADGRSFTVSWQATRS